MNKKLNTVYAFLIVTVAAVAVFAAPNYTGPAPAPDTFGNTAFGNPNRFPASTCVSNTVLGVGAGTAITNGTNNIYIGNAGANESQVVRIGTVGTHTNVYLSGPLTSAAANTNITTIAQGSTGYTNTTAYDGFAYIYATNGAISFYAGNVGTNLIEVTGVPSTAGILTFFLLPGWSLVGTNISGKFVQGP